MKRILIIAFVVILMLLSVFVIPAAKTNFDMTKYLPNDSMTKQALIIHEQEFATESVIQVFIENIEFLDVKALKQEISFINHVKRVVWIDDYLDIDQVPYAMIPHEILSSFYQEKNALVTVILDMDTYDENIVQVTRSIRFTFNDYSITLRGEAIDQMKARQIAEDEMKKVLILIIPVIFAILILASKSWIEPVLILISLGIAVLFNHTTNGFLPDISFITQTLALALQLALSIDYALILIHRYYEERKKHNRYDAIKIARKCSFKSITSSAITTILGFLALMLMSYQVGLDIGLVMSKGILFSYLSSLIVLPILLVWFDSWIQKTTHKPLFNKITLQTHTNKWIRFIKYALFLGLLTFGFLFQSQADYTYSNAPKDQINDDTTKIKDVFGPFSPVLLIIPNDPTINRQSLLMDLMNHEFILSIDSILTSVDPNIPFEYIPESVIKNYIGLEYERMILYTTLQHENQEMYQFIDELNQIVSNQTKTYYILSPYSAIYEIRDIVRSEQIWITLAAVIFVMISIGLIFKSWIIPILLVLVIQCAIWLNVSYVALLDLKIQYIGYLVIMSIQLGATIDYAILMTHRYIDSRNHLSPIESIKTAFRTSSITIIISSLILAVAGFIEGLFSDIATVQDIGFMLGRGALISAFMVLIFLPALLLLFDRFITNKKTKIRHHV